VPQGSSAAQEQSQDCPLLWFLCILFPVCPCSWPVLPLCHAALGLAKRVSSGFLNSKRGRQRSFFALVTGGSHWRSKVGALDAFPGWLVLGYPFRPFPLHQVRSSTRPPFCRAAPFLCSAVLSSVASLPPPPLEISRSSFVAVLGLDSVPLYPSVALFVRQRRPLRAARTATDSSTSCSRCTPFCVAFFSLQLQLECPSFLPCQCAN
jgi:hypothetical protein